MSLPYTKKGKADKFLNQHTCYNLFMKVYMSPTNTNVPYRFIHKFIKQSREYQAAFSYSLHNIELFTKHFIYGLFPPYMFLCHSTINPQLLIDAKHSIIIFLFCYMPSLHQLTIFFVIHSFVNDLLNNKNLNWILPAK